MEFTAHIRHRSKSMAAKPQIHHNGAQYHIFQVKLSMDEGMERQAVLSCRTLLWRCWSTTRNQPLYIGIVEPGKTTKTLW